jgi:hypothetical protein
MPMLIPRYVATRKVPGLMYGIRPAHAAPGSGAAIVRADASLSVVLGLLRMMITPPEQTLQ